MTGEKDRYTTKKKETQNTLIVSRHTAFMNHVINKLVSDGYTFIGREVVVDGITINNKRVIVDIVVEKNKQLIPVECGKIQTPRRERISKLKKVYGAFLHVPYGNFKKDKHICTTKYNSQIRTTLYLNENLLAAYDIHIGLDKRSTAISELMKNDIIAGGGTIE